MEMSTYLANKLLNHIFTGSTYTAPGMLYIGLSMTLPQPDGTNVSEPMGGGYERIAMTPSDWTPPSNRLIQNVGSVTFPAPMGYWGPVKYFTIFDAPTGGNLLIWGPTTSQDIMGGGAPYTIGANELSMQFQPGGFSTYLADAILGHITGKSVLARPTLQLGLSGADPLDDGSGLLEPSNSYARIPIPSWTTSTLDLIKNVGASMFPTCTGPWGDLLYWTLFDSGSHLLLRVKLDTDLDPITGQTLTVVDSNLVFSIN